MKNSDKYDKIYHHFGTMVTGTATEIRRVRCEV